MPVLKKAKNQHPKFNYKTPKKSARVKSPAQTEVSAPEKLVTSHEFWLMQPQFKNERTRLINGKVIRMAPAGYDHGMQASEIGVLLHNFVKGKKLGVTLAAETGFRLNSKDVLAPDAAYVSKERLIENQDLIGSANHYEKFLPFAPNLAVEVVSPGDRVKEIKEKIKAWLDFGTDAVWIVYPKTREIHVYAKGKSVQVFKEADTLDGGDVLPGFTCGVGAIFQNDIFSL